MYVGAWAWERFDCRVVVERVSLRLRYVVCWRGEGEVRGRRAVVYFYTRAQERRDDRSDEAWSPQHRCKT